MRNLLGPACLTVEIIHVAQRTELDNMDPLVLEPLIEVFLLKVRMHFHLMYSWHLLGD